MPVAKHKLTVHADRITGGAGADLFVDKHADHDRIDLSRLKSVGNFTDLKQHHMTEKGHDVVIDGGGGDVLTLKHVDIGDLANGDFTF